MSSRQNMCASEEEWPLVSAASLDLVSGLACLSDCDVSAPYIYLVKSTHPPLCALFLPCMHA